MTLLLLIILVLLILILYWLLQTRKRGPYREPLPLPSPDLPKRSSSRPLGIDLTGAPPFNRDENLLLMLRPGYSLKQLEEFIRSYYPRLYEQKGFVVTPYCHSCDNMIFTVEGLTYSHCTTEPPPHIPNPQPPGSKASGDIGPVFASPNYRFTVRKPSDRNRYSDAYNVVYPSTEGEPVLVAVLDTGVDEYVARPFEPKPVSHCAGTWGTIGYNVIADKSITTDDYQDQNGHPNHGTPVAGFILRSAATTKTETPPNVKILPVKVLDQDGNGSLLQVLCGMAYAKNAGARILNASFGFYAAKEEQVAFYKEFIDKITADNTLIIAAAGNWNEEQSETMIQNEHIRETDVRNLDKNPFYPAAFSDKNDHIIAITTVHKTGETEFAVAEHQNYSASRVQVGVEGDKEDFFLHPFKTSGGRPSWIGSSFATPMFTGLVAATYRTYLDLETVDGNYSRECYLKWLQDNGHLAEYAAPQLQSPSDNTADQVPHLLLKSDLSDTFVETGNREATAAVFS